jgi:hypothetical protein
MDSTSEIALIQAIYDRIFDIVTYSPGGGQKSAFDTKTAFVQLVPLGMPVNPKDFADAVDPSNPKGNLLASEYFARMVDPVPAVQADYAATTKLIDRLYGNIINGANATDKPDPTAVDTYNKAYKYLNKTTTVTGYDGTPTTQIAPTPIYDAYQKNYIAYQTALTGYRTAFNNYDLTDPKQQRQWQANAPLLQAALNNSYNTWRSQGAVQVEQALAAMASSINSAVRSIIMQDQQIYKDTQLTGQFPGDPPWHLSYASPSNWQDPSANNLFTALQLSTSNLKTNSSSHFTSYGGGAAFTNGLWSVGGSFQHQNASGNQHTEATDLQIYMEIAVVNILRPWFDGAFLNMDGWDLGAAYPKGKVSTGDLSTAGVSAALPLLPTAFVVARNIKITGNFGSQDQAFAQSSTSTGVSVGYGPFQLSGNYAAGDQSGSFASNFQSGGITVPGMQIIGWVNQIVPLCPPC